MTMVRKKSSPPTPSANPDVVQLPPVIVTPPPGSPVPAGPPPPPATPGGSPRPPGTHGGGGGGISTPAGAHAYLVHYFDLDFIRDHEATDEQALEATVPTDPETGEPLGASGVTIGYGVDLGHYDPDRLQALADSGSLEQSFVDKIMPYVGRTGNDAQNFLENNPLTFEESERSQLNALSDIRYAGILYERDVAYYNAIAETGNQPHFLTELPKAAATAIADVAVQYPPLADSTPNFWSQIIHAQWHEAAANLHDFGDAFTTRRRDDEAKLRQAIEAGLRDGEY